MFCQQIMSLFTWHFSICCVLISFTIVFINSWINTRLVFFEKSCIFETVNLGFTQKSFGSQWPSKCPQDIFWTILNRTCTAMSFFIDLSNGTFDWYWRLAGRLCNILLFEFDKRLMPNYVMRIRQFCHRVSYFWLIDFPLILIDSIP